MIERINKGVALLEVLITVVVMTTGMLAAVTLLYQSNQQHNSSITYYFAKQCAADRLALFSYPLRYQDFENITSGQAKCHDTAWLDIQLKWEVDVLSRETKSVTVYASWDNFKLPDNQLELQQTLRWDSPFKKLSLATVRGSGEMRHIVPQDMRPLLFPVDSEDRDFKQTQTLAHGFIWKRSVENVWYLTHASQDMHFITESTEDSPPPVLSISGKILVEAETHPNLEIYSSSNAACYINEAERMTVSDSMQGIAYYCMALSPWQGYIGLKNEGKQICPAEKKYYLSYFINADGILQQAGVRSDFVQDYLVIESSQDCRDIYPLLETPQQQLISPIQLIEHQQLSTLSGVFTGISAQMQLDVQSRNSFMDCRLYDTYPFSFKCIKNTDPDLPAELSAQMQVFVREPDKPECTFSYPLSFVTPENAQDPIDIRAFCFP